MRQAAEGNVRYMRYATLRLPRAYTLVEMLVALLVMAALLVIASASFLGNRQHADDIAAQQPLESTRTLAASYSSENNGTLGTDLDAFVAALNESAGSIEYEANGVVDPTTTLKRVTVALDPDKDYATFCSASRTARVYCLRFQPRGRLFTTPPTQTASLWPFAVEAAYAAGDQVTSRCTGAGQPIADAQAAATACLADAWRPEAPTSLNASKAEPGFQVGDVDPPDPEHPFEQEPPAPEPSPSPSPEETPAPTPQATPSPSPEPTPTPQPTPELTPVDEDSDGVPHPQDTDDRNPCLPDIHASSCPQQDIDSDETPDLGDPEVVDPCNPDPQARACNGFLAFLYFTDFEAFDPELYSSSQRSWARSNCGDRYWNQRSSSCTELSFGGQDNIAGPLHTNDQVNICGDPEFGRNVGDAIEMRGGYVKKCSGSDPDFNGLLNSNAAKVALPQRNDKLSAQAAADGVVLYGKHTVKLNGSANSMTVKRSGGSTTTMPMPANGVLYIRHSGSCTQENPTDADYDESSRCGNVYLSGTYSRSLTIAAEGDIVITGDIRHSGTAVLGLIANTNVRIQHEVESGRSGCRNADSSRNITVDAAIVALQHSFLVDNYDCGSRVGVLTVNGAIAQKYRGPVGMGSGSTVTSGFAKNYVYDSRLKTHSPPFFLAPDPQ